MKNSKTPDDANIKPSTFRRNPKMGRSNNKRSFQIYLSRCSPYGFPDTTITEPSCGDYYRRINLHFR